MEDVVRFVLLRRRSDLTHEQFSEYWSTKHVEVLLSAGLREYNYSYTQNHFEALPGRQTSNLRFDGGPQMLQKDPTVIQSGFQQDPRYMSVVRPDEEHFLDAAKGVTLFTDVVPHKEGAKESRKLMIFAPFADCGSMEQGKVSLAKWQDAFLRKHGSSAASCTHYHTIESRGPTPHFDVVVEYWLDTDEAAASLFSRIEKEWPVALNRGNAFSVISHPRKFY
ncbi:EthD domain-containing protein (plasmid) [Agrobacterium leguminum]|uniref:EthD domain-containing protein n=1 Tax=Agrobacterium deltaense NCPPB 1641 TaxID=1183425 RepID=A0A1S7UAZ8_9HYPH|nr:MULTISPECIES: EthD domain-containing protein [Agrobacterium]WFS69762.1 EthD domain-containing protein [Agrobacterium leguminum]CVI64073.1 hypothetical protein AGR7A_pAt30121 [Agrobacterium deltaense NCPPB 1641]